MTNLDTARSKTNAVNKTTVISAYIFKIVFKSNLARKNNQKVVEGSKLTNLLDMEVAVTICILIILRRGTRRFTMK